MLSPQEIAPSRLKKLTTIAQQTTISCFSSKEQQDHDFALERDTQRPHFHEKFLDINLNCISQSSRDVHKFKLLHNSNDNSEKKRETTNSSEKCVFFKNSSELKPKQLIHVIN